MSCQKQNLVKNFSCLSKTPKNSAQNQSTRDISRSTIFQNDPYMNQNTSQNDISKQSSSYNLRECFKNIDLVEQQLQGNENKQILQMLQNTKKNLNQMQQKISSQRLTISQLQKQDTESQQKIDHLQIQLNQEKNINDKHHQIFEASKNQFASYEYKMKILNQNPNFKTQFEMESIEKVKALQRENNLSKLFITHLEENVQLDLKNLNEDQFKAVKQKYEINLESGSKSVLSAILKKMDFLEFKLKQNEINYKAKLSEKDLKIKELSQQIQKQSDELNKQKQNKQDEEITKQKSSFSSTNQMYKTPSRAVDTSIRLIQSVMNQDKVKNLVENILSQKRFTPQLLKSN